ncbi:hypothetical protein ACFE04_016522 [Oxalis oulophora]
MEGMESLSINEAEDDGWRLQEILDDGNGSGGHLQGSGSTSFVGQCSAPHSETYLAEDDPMGLTDGKKRLRPTILSDADGSFCRDSNVISPVSFVTDAVYGWAWCA